jgi:hypothetical protein
LKPGWQAYLLKKRIESGISEGKQKSPGVRDARASIKRDFGCGELALFA